MPVKEPGDPVPVGGEPLDAVGDGDGVVPGVGAVRGDLGAALGVGGSFCGGDRGVHGLVDAVGVPAHPVLGVVPDQDRLPERDLVT